MNLSYLEKAQDYEVKKWLEDELKLTSYQKEILRDNEVVRFSDFYFYTRKEEVKTSFFWRLTVIVFPFYYILLLGFASLKFLITGKFYINQKFIEKVHLKWLSKIGL